MISKVTRKKLVLKKELLRTLAEKHLRIVNGGKIGFVVDQTLPSDSQSTECTYTQPMVCQKHPLEPAAVRW
jgi:hypothetical protein